MTDTTLIHHAALPTTAGATQLDYILIDGSGSMMGQWFDVLKSVDEYIATTKAQHIQSRVLVATFDSKNIHCVQRDEDIDSYRPLIANPIGAYYTSTPLYDAITELGLHLRELNPERASIVIATDGDENASRGTDLVQAKSIIRWMKAKGWQVTFIGCNFNNEKMAHSLGVEPSAAIGVERRHLTDAARSLAEKRARYGHSGAPIHWNDDEKQQFGGYLT